MDLCDHHSLGHVELQVPDAHDVLLFVEQVRHQLRDRSLLALALPLQLGGRDHVLRDRHPLGCQRVAVVCIVELLRVLQVDLQHGALGSLRIEALPVEALRVLPLEVSGWEELAHGPAV